jgi:hypothetical protein
MIDQPHTTNANDLDDLATRRSAYKRPRARKMQPNDRVQRSAAQLLGLGVPVTVAVSHLFEQLDAIGYPSTARQGPTKLHDLPDPANPDLDTTGDSALHAYELGKMKEDLRDAIGDIEKRINALARLVVKITNDPLPGLDGVALCSDGQHGREGVEVWGDPACMAIPAKSGLCTRDYQRERQWRVTADLADRSEPAA